MDLYPSKSAQTTIRYTGLEGGEMGNSRPQYTEGNFDLSQSSDLIRRQVLEHIGTENAGSEIFDVESRDGLWCLPVNPQFGLLLDRDGILIAEGNEATINE
jgi:hypothetical protein